MPTELAETLDAVFPDVMQKFAFSFSENCSKGEMSAPAQGFLARVSFNGLTCGETLLALPTDMGAELAANIMGLEPGCEEAQQCAADSVGELVNLVCGNLLQAHAGQTPVFDLSAPAVSALTAEQWAQLLQDEGVRSYLVDSQHPVLLKFEMR